MSDKIREALEFYANGDHLLLANPDAWDTCSGEPLNWLHDEAGTASVEDGSIAKAALAQQPAQAVMSDEQAAFEQWRSEQIAALERTGYPDAANAFRNLGSVQWAGWQARAMLAAAPAAPVALGIDGCGKPLCGGIEFAGGHHPLCQHHAAPATPEPAPPAQDPCLYAIHYRDNWDGEGDTYYLVAQRAEDGRWLNYESGRELLEYEGDAALEVWPLTSGTTSDKYRAELYDEVWEKARAMGYGNVTMALAELERLKAAAQHDTQAVRDVIAERRRQIDAEGWTPEHDDEHGNGEMAAAAGFYALHANDDPRMKMYSCPMRWPWDPKWWKPGPARRMLVKAGALILAEIERLDRALLGKDGEA